MNNLQTLSMELNSRELQDKKTTDEGYPIYTGNIANKNLTSYYFHLSDKVLRGFAASARSEKGVMVLANHNRGQMVGRSLTGKYINNEEVQSSFFIRPELEFAGSTLFGSSGYKSTDDYIKAIDSGVYTDISVGFRDYTEVCDLCSEEVKPGFFFSGCANGHYPGQRLYIDKDGVEFSEPGKGRKEVVVTSQITDGTLFEYSLVDLGAVPGAEIVQQAQLRNIGDREKKYMLDRYQIDLSRSDLVLNREYRFNRPLELLPSGKKEYSFPSTGKEPIMSDVVTQYQTEALADLQNHNQRLLEENASLKEQVEANENNGEAATELLKQNQALTIEVSKLQAKVAELSAMEEIYSLELESWKSQCTEAWTAMEGGEVNLDQCKRVLDEITTIPAAKNLYNSWNASANSRYNLDETDPRKRKPITITLPKQVNVNQFDAQDYDF